MPMRYEIAAALSPEQWEWCKAREADGTLTYDEDGELEVTDAGWSLVLEVGALGTALEGAELDRAFVRGAAAGAGDVAILVEAVHKLEAILLAGELGLEPPPPPTPPTLGGDLVAAAMSLVSPVAIHGHELELGGDQ